MKPTALKILHGEKNKDRINLNEPKPSTDGVKCPEYLDFTAKKEWVRLEPELKRLGLLTVLDITALAVYCQAYSRFIEAEKIIKEEGISVEDKKGRKAHPMVSVSNQAVDVMRRYMVNFGMNPYSRSKLSVDKGQIAGGGIAQYLD